MLKSKNLARPCPRRYVGRCRGRGAMEQSDYFSLLNRAIVKLDSNTPQARSEIYDRARQALRNQLGAMQPRLPDAAIAKELRQLEGAIRQLEPPQKAHPES